MQHLKNSGSQYRNYKGKNGIIWLGIIGPEYEFIYADVGMHGRNSDGGNWSQNHLKNALENNTLNLLEPRALPAGSC